MEIIPTTHSDIPAVDALLADSYPVLLKPDYPPSVMVTALPLISRARPELVTSGTYFGLWDAGRLVAAGGWTAMGPKGEVASSGQGNIRHVVTDHRSTRKGYGRRLMDHIFADARSAEIALLDCLSTRTAEPFYAAMGFASIGPIDVPLRQGIMFPAIRMTRQL